MPDRPMRRKERLLCSEDSLKLLQAARYGVMACASPDGQPYGVPLSFVFKEGKIYIHCAKEGHKIDNIRVNNKVSFTCVSEVQPVYDKNNFTTYFESVIVFGHVREIQDPNERYAAMYDLCFKYLPDYMASFDEAMQRSGSRTSVYAIIPESITGKAKREEA
jgi:hypothetical protein